MRTSEEKKDALSEVLVQREKLFRAFWKGILKTPRVMLQMTALTATLHGVAMAAEKVPLPETTITFKDGHTIVVPSPKETPLRDLFLPKQRPPEKLVLFFPQIHPISESILNLLDDVQKWHLLQMMMHNQISIYYSLAQLKEQNIVHTVCAEGFTDDGDYSVDQYVKQYREFLDVSTSKLAASYMPDSALGHAMKRYNQIFFDMNVTPMELKELKYDLDPVMHSYAQEYKYLQGADVLHAVENNLSLCAAEHHKTNEAAFEIPYLFGDESDPEYKAKVMENREDVALLQAMKADEPVVALTFGALHEFEDAMERFNESNPDSSIAVAVLESDLPSMHFEQDLKMIGMDNLAIKAVQYAFRLKSWEKAPHVSGAQINEGMQWLERNHLGYGIHQNQLAEIRNIVGKQNE
jgi:hypothetical protein